MKPSVKTHIALQKLNGVLDAIRAAAAEAPATAPGLAAALASFEHVSSDIVARAKAVLCALGDGEEAK